MLDTWPITIPQLTGDEERNAYVYVPEGYDEDARFPVLYMFDGQNLFHDEDASFGRSWRMLDYFESNDIPVIISIGPGFFRKQKVKFYNCEEKDGKLKFKPVTQTKDHYVTITGVLETENVTMMEISSWGKKYYVNWEEYKRYVRKYDNYYFSNILYIKKK